MSDLVDIKTEYSKSSSTPPSQQQPQPQNSLENHHFDLPPPVLCRRPAAGHSVPRNLNRQFRDPKTLVFLDFLHLFRHALLVTDQPVTRLVADFYPEQRIQLANIIKLYFDHLNYRLKNCANITYLELINVANYSFDDFLTYGERFVAFLRNNPAIFPKKTVRLYDTLICKYVQIHPKGVLMLRTKLLELLKKPLGTSGTAGNLEIDYQMVTYEMIDEGKLIAELSTIPFASDQLEHFLSAIALPEVTRRHHSRFLSSVNSALQSSTLSFLRPKVYSFGSIAAGLATYDSDLDIVIQFDSIRESTGTAIFTLDYETSMLALEIIDRILAEKLNLSNLWSHRRLVPCRRCPIIKYEFEHCFVHLKPEEESDQIESRSFISETIAGSSGHSGFGPRKPGTSQAGCSTQAKSNPKPRHFNKCDISVKSLIGVFNAKLLLFLTKCDSRFYQLTIFLKYWAKSQGLLGASAFSSYGFTLMIIYFLQTLNPPVLPSLGHFEQIVQKQMNKCKDFAKFDFCDHLEVVEVSQNTWPLERLIVEFFWYYRYFNYEEFAIVPRVGKKMRRGELLASKAGLMKTNFKADAAIILEDPLAGENNVAAGWTKDIFNKWYGIVKNIIMMERINESNCVLKLLGAKVILGNELTAVKEEVREDDDDDEVVVVKEVKAEDVMVLSPTGATSSKRKIGQIEVKTISGDHVPNSATQNNSEIEFLGQVQPSSTVVDIQKPKKKGKWSKAMEFK